MDTFIVTGERNEGKTSFMARLHRCLQKSNMKISGFICPGIKNKSGSKDFVLQSLNDDSTIHFASREYHQEYNQYGAFFFNPQALKAGNSIIKGGLKNNCDIFILDEVGPIELSGKVWHDLLMNIIAHYSGILIITVRKTMLERVKEYFELKNPVILQIKKTQPEEAARMIIDHKN